MALIPLSRFAPGALRLAGPKAGAIGAPGRRAGAGDASR